MCGLAHIFESEGLSTVLVGFVREHIEVLKPARALFLDFPMGRGMGEPNKPELQKRVIRAAFDLLDISNGPVLKDFQEVIPVLNGRMGYALPVDLVLKVSDIGDVNQLLDEVQKEVSNLLPDYHKAKGALGRTTVGRNNQVEKAG